VCGVLVRAEDDDEGARGSLSYNWHEILKKKSSAMKILQLLLILLE